MAAGDLSLSEAQVSAIAFIEQCWFTKHSLPTNERISKVADVNVSTVMKWWQDEGFRKALLMRGIDLRSEEDSEVLTIQQVAIVDMMLNFHDKRTNREKLEAAGVSSQQYHAWLKQPAFQAYVRKLGEKIFGAVDHEAYMSLIKQFQTGDTSALKLFFEMRGLYTPKQQQTIFNVDLVVVRLLEVIQKHVRDPELLEAIATDFEAIMEPKKPEPTPLGPAGPHPSLSL